MGVTANESEVSFGCNKNVLKVNVVMVVQFHEYRKNIELCTLSGCVVWMLQF